MDTPKISLVVVVFNMKREAARTLHSLSTDYQRNIGADDYEVIVVDNGSDPPLDISAAQKLPGNFRFIRAAASSASPASAANQGLAEARHDLIGVMIDGARIVTPRLLHFARHAATLFERSVVATIGWYLGFDFQRWAIRHGYNQDREDALLAKIEWPQDGYRLFEIGTPDESSIDGWLQPIAESNALFMSRALWNEVGGFDERFDEPGGGLVNHDIFRRALELPEAELVYLLGEATFHQLHHGVATNSPVEKAEANWKRWVRQYEQITGRSYEWPRPQQRPNYVGSLTRTALLHFTRSALYPVPRELVEGPRESAPLAEPPLGRSFDADLWSLGPCVSTSEMCPLIALMHEHIRDGHYSAAAGIARLIRQHRPEESEPQRVLSFLAPYSPEPWNAVYSEALSKANELLAALP
jgi:glycosyltransferase involved in cell wall biosynthesis